MLTKFQVYGVANLDDNPCTEDTLFDCASTSKSFTAACVALLVDDEAYPEVQWRTPVSKILPDDFVLPDPYLTANVTIEDILSHRTGNPGHDDALYGQKAAQPDNAKSVTRNLRNLPFNKPFRSDYQYSNIMYTVATHLIETVTGELYSDFVRRRIWEPLGMLNTYHDVTGIEAGNAKDRLAMGYHWDMENKQYLACPPYVQPEVQGAGCEFSSVSDYAKWVRALVQRSSPLSEDAHKEMVKGRTIVPYEGNDALPLYGHSLYALGLIVESYRGYTLIGHDGSMDGYKALMRYLPEQKWGIVMFGNSEDAFYAIQILAHELMDDVFKVREEERINWAAYWRKCWKDEEKEEQEENSDLLPPESPEPVPVPLDELAGDYFHAGYRTLVLTLNHGSLEADCSDRCVPFKLRIDHLSGTKFVVDYRNMLDRSVQKLKAEFDIDEDGTVKRLGIPLCADMKDDFIWFHRLQ
jgi:CubicO group peptidase (beta-lactamase class C family)